MFSKEIIIMSTNSVIRMDDLVVNKSPQLAANKEYYMVYILTDTGSMIPCLLTENDVTKGIDRAGKNPEDVAKLNLFQKVYHRILNWF